MRRPTKYMVDAVTMLRETLERGMMSQCLTDEDAIARMNDLLMPYGQFICFRTFQRYKAAARAFGELTVEEQAKFDPLLRDLYRTFQRSQIDQKELIYCAMMEADGHNWIKYRWMLERKFPDFNLKKVTEKYLAEAEIEQMLLEMDLAAMGLPINKLRRGEEVSIPAPALQPAIEAAVQEAPAPQAIETLVAPNSEVRDEDFGLPPKPSRTPEQIRLFEKQMDDLEKFMDPDKVERMRRDWRHKWGIKGDG